MNEPFPSVVSDILLVIFCYFYSFFGNFTEFLKLIYLFDTVYFSFFCKIML